jgi:hypothetical protein
MSFLDLFTIIYDYDAKKQELTLKISVEKEKKVTKKTKKKSKTKRKSNKVIKKQAVEVVDTKTLYKEESAIVLERRLGFITQRLKESPECERLKMEKEMLINVLKLEGEEFRTAYDEFIQNYENINSNKNIGAQDKVMNESQQEEFFFDIPY